MKAWQIFRHSVRQVTGNLPDALRLSLVPVLVQVVAVILLVGVTAASLAAAEARQPGAGFAVGFTIGFIVTWAAVLWIAVAWHRFVLLGETPHGWFPPFHGARIWAYFLRSLAYLVLTVVAAAVLGGILGLVLAMAGVDPGATPIWMTCLMILVAFPAIALSLRLSAGLPGAAIGAGTDFAAGWRATEGANGTFLGLGVILILVQGVLSGIGIVLNFANLSILSFAWDMVTSWLMTMVGVSVLTTLYGHYVEGRPLV